MSDHAVERIRSCMLEVQGGSFLMGATQEQGEDALETEKPAHAEKVGDFMICRYPVTQGEWEALMGDNPSDFRGDPQLPVETVSWEDAMSFIALLNSLTDGGYRLPTEAEWEYAARGGHLSKGFRYSGGDDPDEVAWTRGNSGARTHPVGLLKPNELGLYDMSGNVWEWCAGPWRDYTSDPSVVPDERPYPNHRASRGGSWLSDPMFARVSSRSGDIRSYRGHDSGFRLAG